MASVAANAVCPGGLTHPSEQCTQLYRLRDTFFPPNAGEKENKMRPVVKEIVVAVDAFVNDSTDGQAKKRADKAYGAYLKGKALSVFEVYDAEGEKHLSKSVKLDPSNIDAWNCLGECFWKKQDFGTAKTCFEGALKQSRTRETLGLYSMLLRQIRPDNTSMVENIRASIAAAKEAVSLGYSDAHSWYVLGNAYLGSFFNLAHDPADLTRALKAYENAEKHRDDGVNALPDLFFNRAEVHSYLQNYNLAIQDYRRAGEVDPLGLQWEDCVKNLRKKVLRANELLRKRCGVKPKRLDAMCKAMLANQHHKAVVATSEKQESEKLRSKFVGVSSLNVGPNPGTVVPLSFLLPVVDARKLTPCLVMMCDRNQECVCVALYHVGYDRLDFFNSKHVYHVIDPVVKIVELDNGPNGEAVKYPCIQVEHPNRLLRDGNLLSSFYTHATTIMKNKG
eukprot:g5192.t1